MQMPKTTEDDVSIMSFYVTDDEMLNFLTNQTTGSNSKNDIKSFPYSR